MHPEEAAGGGSAGEQCIQTMFMRADFSDSDIRYGASSDTELFKNHRSTIRFQGHRIATCLYRTPMGSCV